MGLPGHHRTSSDKRRRSAHFALKTSAVNACAKCGKPVRSHNACGFCGTYKGKQVINVDRRLNRTARKSKKAKK